MAEIGHKNWPLVCHTNTANIALSPDFAPAHDLDHDGDVDIIDTMLVVKHWGETCR